MKRNILGLVLLLLIAVAPAARAMHALGEHWKKRSDLVVVRVIDQTGGRFPVRAVVDDWNRSGAPIKYVFASSCPAGKGCVYVRTRAMNYLGLTTIKYDSTNHIYVVAVNLSSSRSMNAYQRRSVTCQEMGHALGLDHRYVNSSCMVNSGYFPQHPDQHDYDELHTIYKHTHTS